MIIKKIKLHNIRSYIDEAITLPRKSVLLSGDIGSGKSTVLLAIEFALFGLQRGTMDGAVLLRNGKDEGSIELELEIGKEKNIKNILIKRQLKRKKDKIVQSSAFLSVNGIKRELTSNQLKSFILEILNYPPSLLKKKNMIYRYTVYTPQEEMKKIILEDKDNRLDTLRKVFDIDKYKRILNNAEIFSAKIKEKKKEKEGQLLDLPFKKEQLKEKEDMAAGLKKKIESLKPPLEKIKDELTKLKEQEAKEQQFLKEISELKIKLAETDAELKEKKFQLNSYQEESKEIEAKIKKIEVLNKELNQELKSVLKPIQFAKSGFYSLDDINSEKLKIKTEIARTEDLLEKKRIDEKKLEREIAVLKSEEKKLNEDSKRIPNLEICPVCKQKVTSKHKDKIAIEISQELKKIGNQLKEKNPLLEILTEEIKKLSANLKELTEKEKDLSQKQIRFRHLKEEREEEEKRKLKIRKAIEEFNKKIISLEEIKKLKIISLEKYISFEEQHKKTLQDLELKQREEKTLLVERTRYEQSSKDLQKAILELKNEIKNKEEINKQLSKFQEIYDFLTKNFSLTVEMIEKQVMLKLNVEFNSLFKKWFMMLVDDPDLEARIDSDFTPVIEQAGYEINYNYLSGGEKTALALAYRLALNQVINSMLSKINTKDILILDEPTDGFSYEQLNKMRDVLHELKTEQLILVSHESKVESFVQHVLKFVKQGHISHVIS